VTAATAAEKERLAATFVRLCGIESPSGREGEVARAVSDELASIGLDVVEDDTRAETGAGSGNLLARLPGPEGARTIMLCAHLDTVPLSDVLDVELVDGYYVNRRNAILGADNKAAVAVLLMLARRYASGGSPVACELLFTASEENGLRGARAFDISQLRSDFGYVFDHATPIGELVVAAPTYYEISAEFRGRAAHSGIRPEEGRSAIVAAAKAIDSLQLGRLDAETTANVGRVEGGTATNVVPARCTLVAEVRSLDHARATAQAQEMVDALTWAASSTETDVDAQIEEQFRAYRLSESHPSVVAAATALRDSGVEPVYTATGGGSDASAFHAKGFSCLNVANGTEHNHTADERVSVAALERMLDVSIALLARAADV
jgi:tripeptide aminopeptidase